MTPEHTIRLTSRGAHFDMWDNPGKICASIRGRNEPYEKDLLHWVADQGFAGVAVDAGANFGNHTLWFARMCGLRVHAFEPLQYGLLAANVALNGLLSDGVTVYPYGLGERREYLGTAGKGRLRPTKATRAHHFVIPLDELGLTDVSLVKVDVEGMEPQVLRGATETLTRCRPTVLTEEWTERETAAVRHVLEPLGYSRVLQIGGKRRDGSGHSAMGVWRI